MKCTLIFTKFRESFGVNTRKFNNFDKNYEILKNE